MNIFIVLRKNISTLKINLSEELKSFIILQLSRTGRPRILLTSAYKQGDTRTNWSLSCNSTAKAIPCNTGR
jgi:hypothetical protein